MTFLPSERTALFIDGAYIYAASRNLGFEIDYKGLLAYFRKHTNVVRAHYYSIVADETDNETGKPAYNPIKPLNDFLAYNGYAVLQKSGKVFADNTGRTRLRGDISIELATEMLDLAYTHRFDHFVMFSGDGDFRKLVESVQRQGVRVSVVATLKTTPIMIGDELRRQADNFIELSDIGTEFTRQHPAHVDAGMRSTINRRGRITPANPDGEDEFIDAA